MPPARLRNHRPTGSQTRLEYDERQLVFKSTSAFGTSLAATTRFDYDLNGALSVVTDPLSKTVAYTRDGFGRRPTVITNQLGHTVNYGYDAAGNPLTVEARSSSNTQLAMVTNYYDEVGRLWKVAQARFGPGLSLTSPTTIVSRDKSDRITQIQMLWVELAPERTMPRVVSPRSLTRSETP